MKRLFVSIALIGLTVISLQAQSSMSKIRVSNLSIFPASVLFVTSDATNAVIIGEVSQGKSTSYTPLTGSDSVPYILYVGATRSALTPVKILTIQPGYSYELQIVDGTFPKATDYNLVVIGKYE